MSMMINILNDLITIKLMKFMQLADHVATRYIHVWKVKKALSVNNATKIPIVIMLHIVVCVRINCRNTLNLV